MIFAYLSKFLKRTVYLFSLTVSLDTYLFVMKEIHGLHRNGIPAEKISLHLSPWASALFEFLPHFIRREVFSSSVYIYCFLYILCTKLQVSQPITTSEIHQYRHQVFIWVCKVPFLFIYLVVYVHVWGEEGGVLVSLCNEVIHFCSNILINTVLIIFPLLHSYYYSQSLITQHSSLRYISLPVIPYVFLGLFFIRA